MKKQLPDHPQTYKYNYKLLTHLSTNREQQNYKNIYNLSKMAQSSIIKPNNICKELFKEEEECPYCLMKQKFGFSQKKCLEHSLKNQEEEGIDHEEDCDSYLTAQEMVEMLKQVENGLQYYWNNLRVLSQGSPTQIQTELEPVLVMSKKVQQKIRKFFYDESMHVSQFKVNNSLNNYKPSSEEENTQMLQIQNNYEFESDTQNIKEWVLHFYNVMACRKVIQPIDTYLPLQDQETEMKIFKESMQRKFLIIANQLQKYQAKIPILLNKLIFYMEKSSENVPQQTIQSDILFIEGNPEVQPTEFQVYSDSKQKLWQQKSNSLQDLLANTSLARVQQDEGGSGRLFMKDDEFQKLLLAQASCIETLLSIQE